MAQVLEYPSKLKSEIFNKLSLLSEVRSEGYDVAVRHKYGEELAYIVSLKNKSNKELFEEREALRSYLINL